MPDEKDLQTIIDQNIAADLDQNQRDVLSKKIVSSINDWAVSEYLDPFRWHLGASIIGRECDRFLYFSFRWVFQDTRDGRMLRLLQRGKEEEKKFSQYLRGIGCEVYDVDPDTGKQFRFSAHKGHFGGSTDGVLRFPEAWGIPGFFLPEYKTNQTGAGFNNLIKEGVEKQKEDHYIQQCLYGKKRNIKYSVYLNVNKNDDDLYCEIVPLDYRKAEIYEKRAHDIIFSDYVPAMMPGAKPTFFKCKMCPGFDVCHKGKAPERNCRSCIHSQPVDNAEWECTKFGQVIPREFVYKGCEDYKAIL